MGERRTAWHYFLGLLLAEKAPRGFEVRAEVPVTRALLHMDCAAPPTRGRHRTR
ncbi:MAG: hypothetical protein IPN17_37280 [Deltaproteobacteria bacterium]|nr:hypothetical protein [Deltaproteobacteria bacterium]